jgi:hypothetical protein
LNYLESVILKMETPGFSEVLSPVSAKVVIDASPKKLTIQIATVRTCVVTSRRVGGTEVQRLS